MLQWDLHQLQCQNWVGRFSAITRSNRNLTVNWIRLAFFLIRNKFPILTKTLHFTISPQNLCYLPKYLHNEASYYELRKYVKMLDVPSLKRKTRQMFILSLNAVLWCFFGKLSLEHLHFQWICWVTSTGFSSWGLLKASKRFYRPWGLSGMCTGSVLWPQRWMST